jgi:hypothetical protein
LLFGDGDARPDFALERGGKLRLRVRLPDQIMEFVVIHGSGSLADDR